MFTLPSRLTQLLTLCLLQCLLVQLCVWVSGQNYSVTRTKRRKDAQTDYTGHANGVHSTTPLPFYQGRYVQINVHVR